jgi:hypothetical protein
MQTTLIKTIEPPTPTNTIKDRTNSYAIKVDVVAAAATPGGLMGGAARCFPLFCYLSARLSACLSACLSRCLSFPVAAVAALYSVALLVALAFLLLASRASLASPLSLLISPPLPALTLYTLVVQGEGQCGGVVGAPNQTLLKRLRTTRDWRGMICCMLCMLLVLSLARLSLSCNVQTTMPNKRLATLGVVVPNRFLQRTYATRGLP